MDTTTYDVHPVIARAAGISPIQNITEQEPVITQEQPLQVEEAAPLQEAPQEESFEEIQARDKQFRAFKELREARDRAERERDELQRRIAESQQARPAPEDDLIDVLGGSDDDLIERKHLKKFYSSLEKKLEQKYKHAEERALEAQIRSRYPDFDTVVTNERVAQFTRDYPEIAQSLGASPDQYNKAISVYKMLKQFGYDKEAESEYTKQRVQSNAVRPKTATSISAQRPSSGLQQADAFARGLTPDLQKQLYREMLDAMKQR